MKEFGTVVAESNPYRKVLQTAFSVVRDNEAWVAIAFALKDMENGEDEQEAIDNAVAKAKGKGSKVSDFFKRQGLGDQ